ncbi:MAG: glutamate racemase [Anaerolineae bacterium]|nr:glutamate racemase [Anaerolineae bacterium]
MPETIPAQAMIGVLDSGVGGLSVLREIHDQLPGYPTIYYADQAHLPYGPRPQAEIRRFVEQIADFLIAQGVTVVVIACHAASAAGLHYLRARHPDIPIVGIEPAVKPAAERTQTGVIGVLTTQATADGSLYRRVIERFATNTRVITQVSPALVTLAEAGAPQTPESRALVAGEVEPLLAAGADQIVLACTHFPFVAPLIRDVVDGRAALVDPSTAVARQVGRVLAVRGDGALTATHPAHRYCTSGDPAAFSATIARLCGVRVTAEQCRLDQTTA